MQQKIEINPEELPITGNRFYENISEEEFFAEAKKMDFYTLDELQPNAHVVLFRAAKLETGETVFQKIEARVMERFGNSIHYFHHGTLSHGKSKAFHMGDSYKKSFFFLKPEDIEEQNEQNN